MSARPPPAAPPVVPAAPVAPPVVPAANAAAAAPFDVQALTAAIVAAATAMAQAGAAAAPPVAPPVAAATAIVGFARTPAQASQGMLDYEHNSTHAKIFTKATAAFPTVFSLAKPNVAVLLTELRTRAKTFAWTELMLIAIDGVNHNFIDCYGRVTLPEVLTHVNTFIDSNVGDDGRLAQNDYQLFMATMESIDADTKGKMEIERPSYMAGAARDIESGLLFVKKLLMLAEADSRAITAHARTNLTNLDSYMASVPDGNIVAFNDYVKKQMQTLSTRGETTHDLVIHLFKGYMASTSTDFKDFIKRKKESHRENAIDYTPESLMLAAENHYNAMKLDGEWNGVAVDPPLVLALRAQIKDLEKRNHRNGGGDGGGGGGGGGGRGGPPQPPSVRFQGDQAWKAVPPKVGDPPTKKQGRTTFQWCPHHNFWTAHKAEDCTLANRNTPTPAAVAAPAITPAPAAPVAPPAATPAAPPVLSFAAAAAQIQAGERGPGL
jgi:hypothetical protein